MPSWLLRLFAIAVSALSMVGSTGYVLYHPKNPAAPLQPGVVEPVGGDEQQTAGPSATTRPLGAGRATPPPTQLVLVRSAPPSSASTSGPQAVVVTLPPTPAPRPPAATARATPLATVRVATGVRATQLPQITTTHSS